MLSTTDFLQGEHSLSIVQHPRILMNIFSAHISAQYRLEQQQLSVLSWTLPSSSSSHHQHRLLSSCSGSGPGQANHPSTFAPRPSTSTSQHQTLSNSVHYVTRTIWTLCQNKKFKCRQQQLLLALQKHIWLCLCWFVLCIKTSAIALNTRYLLSAI